MNNVVPPLGGLPLSCMLAGCSRGVSLGRVEPDSCVRGSGIFPHGVAEDFVNLGESQTGLSADFRDTSPALAQVYDLVPHIVGDGLSPDLGSLRLGTHTGSVYATIAQMGNAEYDKHSGIAQIGAVEATPSKIKAYIAATKGASVTGVAAKIGISRDVLSNMLNGRTEFDITLLEPIRLALKAPADWLKSSGDGLRVSAAGTPMVPLAVAGRVAAGAGTHNVDPEQRTVWVPERLAQLGRLALEVEGDSAMPLIQPGDVAVFKEHTSPRRRYAFLVKTRDGDRIKLVDWDQNGQYWTLQSLNKREGPIKLADGDQLCGYLVGWYRCHGTRESTISDPNGLIISEEEFAQIMTA